MLAVLRLEDDLEKGRWQLGIKLLQHHGCISIADLDQVYGRERSTYQAGKDVKVEGNRTPENEAE